jgi:hypothetical protein
LYVLSRYELATSESWARTGYDLDGFCTDTPEAEAECRPPAADVPERDGDDGIDNTIGHHLFPLLAELDPTFGDELSARLRRAEANAAFEIRGWNGQPDDPQVRVTFATTAYGLARTADGSIPDHSFDGERARLADGSAAEPAWEGDDVFWLRGADFHEDGGGPRAVTEDGYVRGGELVAPLPRAARWFVLTLPDAYSVLSLRRGVLTAELDGGLALRNVVIAGAWPGADFVAELERAGYCPGSIEYDIASKLVQDVADLRTESGGAGGSGACDALSFGLRGEAVRGERGGLVAVGVPSSACPTE